MLRTSVPVEESWHAFPWTFGSTGTDLWVDGVRVIQGMPVRTGAELRAAVGEDVHEHVHEHVPEEVIDPTGYESFESTRKDPAAPVGPAARRRSRRPGRRTRPQPGARRHPYVFEAARTTNLG